MKKILTFSIVIIYSLFLFACQPTQNTNTSLTNPLCSVNTSPTDTCTENILTLDSFQEIEPGISNYQDVYKICSNIPMVLTSHAHGTVLEVNAGNNKIFYIRFDMENIVISIEYSRDAL